MAKTSRYSLLELLVVLLILIVLIAGLGTIFGDTYSSVLRIHESRHVEELRRQVRIRFDCPETIAVTNGMCDGTNLVRLRQSGTKDFVQGDQLDLNGFPVKATCTEPTPGLRNFQISYQPEPSASWEPVFAYDFLCRRP